MLVGANICVVFELVKAKVMILTHVVPELDPNTLVVKKNNNTTMQNMRKHVHFSK